MDSTSDFFDQDPFQSAARFLVESLGINGDQLNDQGTRLRRLAQNQPWKTELGIDIDWKISEIRILI